MRWFSIFSGIGGFDIALQNLGHEIIGACEIDRYARQIYERHFPGTRIWKDARTIEPKELPEHDAICGGFPCQAFSVAGKRLGFEDTRGTLFYEIVRIAKERRPRLLFLENVEGLLSHDRGRTFATILATLDEIGYDAEWQCFNTKYFLPQNRPRVFIIGHLRGESRRQIFPIRGSEEITTRTHQKKPRRRERFWSEDHTGTIQRNYWKARGTLIQINKGIRKLTPLECERLQGFPDNWTFGLSDTQRYKCIGNAVSVPVVQFIAKHL